MPNFSNLATRLGVAGALAVLARRRRRHDPVHAPGHRHRKLPPDDAKPARVDLPTQQDQPWIRRSHSDSQKRRFRR